MSGRPRGRHALSVPRRITRTIRGLLCSFLTLVVTVALFTAASGGTYAMWNGSQGSGSAATITSGTAAITVTSGLAMPVTPMYPGSTIRGSAVVQNTGDVPLAIRVTSLTGPTATTTFSQALTIGIATASSAADCTNGVVTSAWSTGTFAAPPVATIGSTIAKKTGTARLCVSVTLASNVAAGAQGQAATNFAIIINGNQV